MRVFSKQNPTVRLVWDPTTLAAFMLDPLSYYWKYVQGWRSREPSIDVLWGRVWDKCMSFYHHYRAERVHNLVRQQATEATIAFAIEYARKIDLDAVAAESKYKARKKNLATLTRSIVWYDDELGDYEFYEPVIAQPTRVVAPLNMTTLAGEPYHVASNFDQVVRSRETGHLMVVERKSTTDTISKNYWLQFDPSVQTSTYDWAAVAAHSVPGALSGVTMEAVQTVVGFSRFAHHDIIRTPQQRTYWERTMRFWIRRAEEIALADDWEVAWNVAGQRWESTVRNIQRRSPAVWEGLLRTEMVQREPWNPLEVD